MKFIILRQDTETSARLGRISTAHGEVTTPAFLPVGTAGS
ncbi:MAG TPA: tRNA guanosine(34) transglycosylase Tgt, partial [Nitrospiria bacterium]|nr:tRNA guanosine(34) transglycosylase Tgt [Nitrospiria bacterium]